MRKIAYPRFDILRTFDELCAGICPNRFVTTRPNAVGEQMQEFLLLRLPQPMRDLGDTYQTTYGQIIVFVRDVQGMENTYRLEQLQSKVMVLFPVVTERFSAVDPLLLASASDGAGFHSLAIQFSISINKKPIN